MLDITLIGTGATMPLPERAVSATAIGCNGRVILIDCGEGTQAAAKKAHVSLMKIDAICLTHFHGDHIFGLPGLLQTIGSLGRTEPMTIFGPEGVEDIMKLIMDLCVFLPYEIKVVQMMTEETKCLELSKIFPGWPAGAKLEGIQTEHRVSCCGYKFVLSRTGKFQPDKAKELGVPQKDWKLLQKGESVMVGDTLILPEQVLGEARSGLSVVISGDTKPCDALIEAAKGADLLVGEATFGENEEAEIAIERGHSTFAQMAEIALRAEVKRLWLTHFSGSISEPEEYLPNAKVFYENAECGYDGKTITLKFDEK